MALRIVPPLPGAVIRQRVLKKFGLRQADLARAMGMSKVRINHILNGKAPVTASVALRLAYVTDTAPEDWMTLQSEHELFRAKAAFAEALPQLIRLPRPGDGP